MTSSTKAAILVFIDWFYPGYLAGGPVQSVLSLIQELHHDFEFWVFTTNRDLNGKVPYPNIISNTWTKSQLGCNIYYADPSSLNRSLIIDVISQCPAKVVYINSLFSRYFSVLPLHLIKHRFSDKTVLLAPRGMLGAGALSLKRHKKWVFLHYAKLSGLFRTVTWHATSSQEEKEIRLRIDKSAKCVIIPNLPKRLQPRTKSDKKTGELKLFFASRISRKKNLLFCLDILRTIRQGEIRFHIYGPVEDEAYWASCKELIVQMPPRVQVAYKGTFSPEEAANIHASEEVLFLPTLNENFGHAIVESLLCACPVIISDQTPWTDLQKAGAGFTIPLSDKEAFRRAVETFTSMGPDEFSAFSKKAFEYISTKIDLDGTVTRYRNLFYELLKN
ncbi:MAG TPA: glycosyltransferase [Bacteroidia bacterium]|nr:glycosyltransferase [Bacteroidia bacterium]